MADGLYHKGLFNMRLGNYRETIEQVLSAVEIKQPLGGDVGPYYLLLGFTYIKAKQYEASTKALNKALEEAKQGFH